jgi:fatty-acyl-CoA synthase
MFDGDLLSERARVTPNRVALVSVETGERITYHELNERAERAAATLRTILEPGDRFGLLSHNSVEFLELFFAAGKADVIVVPLSTRATEHELKHIANDCAMKALFYGPGFEAMDLGIPAWSAEARPPLSDSRANAKAARWSRTPNRTASSTRAAPRQAQRRHDPRRQLWNGYNTVVNWDCATA